MYFDQSEWDVRCEWGAQGVAALAPVCDVLIVVDVLSFSTCVDIATARGALVYPYRFRDETAERYAVELGATLARPGRTAGAGYSLSPHSLLAIPAGARLVLPSPNGATLTLAAGGVPTLAGCLRNARAVALAAARFGRRVGVIAAGERWADGGLRSAIEDWLGAGAIIGHLPGERSPEAELARQSFAACAALGRVLHACGSGRELVGRGFAEDVALAAALDQSDCAPLLIDGAYQRIKDEG
jgi:2-phosphosulfolactate phosphatase